MSDMRFAISVAAALLATLGCAIAVFRKIQRSTASLNPAPPVPQPSAPAAPIRQLPPPSRYFTGRQQELNHLLSIPQPIRILITSSTALPGMGRTALALALAELLRPRYPDAQFYLDLNPASVGPMEPCEILAHFLRSCLPESSIPEDLPSSIAAFRPLLEGKSAILLLENASDPAQIEPVIPPPSCALIVTSRSPLALPGFFTLDLDRTSPADCDALLLRLVPRIGNLASEMARLCGHVPLALKLCAGLLAVHADMAPADLLRLLAIDRDADMSEIDAALSLGDVMLPLELRQMWHVLIVFPDTFDRLAAAAVWELPREGADEALGILLRHCLLEYDSIARRYRLQASVRAFIRSRIASADLVKAQRRHADYFRAVASAADSLYFKSGPSARRGLALFDTEWLNIQAGFEWARLHTPTDEHAARLCAAYPAAAMSCLSLRHHPREWIIWLDAAMAAARCLKDRLTQAIEKTPPSESSRTPVVP